jgi:hypothetical protein
LKITGILPFFADALAESYEGSFYSRGRTKNITESSKSLTTIFSTKFQSLGLTNSDII